MKTFLPLSILVVVLLTPVGALASYDNSDGWPASHSSLSGGWPLWIGRVDDSQMAAELPRFATTGYPSRIVETGREMLTISSSMRPFEGSWPLWIGRLLGMPQKKMETTGKQRPMIHGVPMTKTYR